MWTFVQRTGEVLHNDAHFCFGYAGAQPDGYNNPEAQAIHNVGPLPCGRYTMGKPYDSPHTGPFTIPLMPNAQNTMYGRSEFKIHGDDVKNPGHGSDGCIVLSRTNRQLMWESGDDDLLVVAESPNASSSG